MKKLIFSVAVVFMACLNKPIKTEDLALPFFKDAYFTPIWLKGNSVELKNFHQIPPFQLINQHGDTITEKNIDGKIVVADFFFTTCPGICTRMTDNMKVLQDKFKNDSGFILLSHSVTPGKDSVAQLKKYALAKGITATNWHLLTGNQAVIYELGRKSYFAEADLGLEKKAEDFLHTENFILLDKSRRIRGIYNGLNKKEINQLVKDIEQLKKAENQ